MGKNKRAFKITSTKLIVFGLILLVIFSSILITTNLANNNQSEPMSVAKVRFEGKYKIADGDWQTIKEGEHIAATKGDVLLKGKFAYYTPDRGEFIRVNLNKVQLAFHLHHLNCAISTSDGREKEFDAENEAVGQSSCGKTCVGYTFIGSEETIVTIKFHNPHTLGNDKAIDEFLDKLAIYNGTDYEKEQLNKGAVERTIGLIFIIAALVLLGISIFSALLKIIYTKEMALVGLLMLFAGTHYVFSSEAVYFWNQLVAFNTVSLLLSTMLFMLIAVITVYTQLSKRVKNLSIFAVAISLISAIACIIISIVSNVYFYDAWLIFLIAQLVATLISIVCIFMDIRGSSKNQLLIKIPALLLFLSIVADYTLNTLGVLNSATITKIVVIVVFAIALVLMLKLIPQNINGALRAKELASEQQALKLELQKSRVSLMLSQIKPHFIYNTLGTIGEFCEEKPQKAKQLVQEFALYLRGNFGELDNMNPIPVMQEMEHVKHYVKIENVRFPDMVMTFDLQAKDFFIPALSVQPLVENAIKHGLLKLESGGTVTVKSYETPEAYCISVEDDGVGFDCSEKMDERKHIGIRNIRDRLRIMCDGNLTITSKVGVGTTAIITIPKENLNESDNG